METETVRRRGRNCTLVYEKGEDWEEVRRCIPDQGMYLFEVKANYAKKPPVSYYRLGSTPKEVRDRFSKSMTWLDVVSVRLIPPGDEARGILHDPLRMPM